VVDWIDGAINLRDFGGYPTSDGRRLRSGLLFRSGDTCGISSDGLARVAGELGVRTVIDLRSDRERQRASSRFEDHGVLVVHEPLDPGNGISPGAPPSSFVRGVVLGELDWVSLYWSLVRNNGSRFARILDQMGRPGTLPVLIHCAGGRDRTGVAVALIQAAVGVSDGDIAADYAMSGALLERTPVAQFERLLGGMAIDRAALMRAMATRPETMHALLERIRGVYGDVRALLETCGADAGVLARLREATCEQDANAS
jgi:protein-tyrosine phosphatase